MAVRSDLNSWRVVGAGAIFFLGIASFHGSLPSTRISSNPLTQRPSEVRPFDPDRQSETSAESEDLSISLSRMEPCGDCGGGRAFTFEVRHKRRGTLTSFTIRNETAQIDEIAIVNSSRAIVLGSVSGTVRIVNVVDLEANSVRDSFYCHFPSIYGRFIAYVKFAPRHPSPLVWSFVYLVYDVLASPEQNRLSGGRGLEDRERVGIPIYPLENVERKVYEPVILDEEEARQIAEVEANPLAEEEAHSLGSEGLFWLQEGVVAFVDRWKRKNHLVVVDVRSGLA